MEHVTIWLALAAGLLSFLSPCVLPLAPAYLGIISGTSLANLQSGAVKRRQIFMTTLAFVSGFTLVFMMFGVASSFLGQVLFSNRDWLSRVGGVVVIFLGLHQAGWLKIPWLYHEKRLTLGRSIGMGGAFLAGLAFSLGWTPCVGPILAAILAVAGNQANLGQGVLLLLAYSIGLALPFFGLALAFGWFSKKLDRVKPYMQYLEWAAGTLLILMGLVLLTGSFSTLSGWFMQLTGGWDPESILKK